MYDISGWSHRLLWGASVDIAATADLPVVGKAGRRVAGADRRGRRAGRPRPAPHARRRQGRRARSTRCSPTACRSAGAADGSVVVPAAARARPRPPSPTASACASPRAPPAPRARRSDRTVIAAAVAADELSRCARWASRSARCPPRSLNAGSDCPAWTCCSSRRPVVRRASRRPPGPQLRRVPAHRGGVVTRGRDRRGLQRRRPACSPVTAGRRHARRQRRGRASTTPAGRSAPARCRTPSSTRRSGSPTSAPGVVVEQRYAHRQPAGRRATGSAARRHRPGRPAAGQAAVVSRQGERGASVVLFGTEPLFRDHPKGLYSQVARAVLHTDVTAGAAVAAP